jgi:branched-chain amino acid transport system ATP-binding protein
VADLASMKKRESRRLKDLPKKEAPVLSLDKICKSFGGLSVLFEVDLFLFPKEIVGLIGPNGAGKSTLFNVITSMYLPDGGDIFLNGEKITGRSPHSICRMGVSRTFQLVKVFLSMTALDNVLVGATYGHSQRLTRRKAERASLECLDLVELSEKKDIPAAHLTLSDRRLLEVARALASGPSVTLLDEPMAGLNPSETMKMLQVINRAREEKNVAILWVEHKVDAIFHLCDRVVVLDYGRKIAEGTPEEIAGNSRVIEAYLGASPS